MEFQFYFVILQQKHLDMEKKKYPTFMEDDSVGMASEPMETMAVDSKLNSMAYVHDEPANIDWDNYPIFGPKTLNEAIARIEKAEAEKDDPTKWMSSEQMWDMMHEKYPWLR